MSVEHLSIDWAALLFSESLVFSVLSVGLLSVGMCLSLRERWSVGPMTRWSEVGVLQLTTPGALRRFLLSVAFVTGVVLATYTLGGSAKDAWDASNTALGLVANVVILLGLVKLHQGETFLWSRTDVRYALYSLAFLIAGFVGYLASHRIPGLLPWTNAALWTVLVFSGMKHCYASKRRRDERFLLLQLSGWIFAVFALILHVATLVTLSL